MNVADYLLECGEDQRVALVADRSYYTYLDLKRTAASLAREIVQAGAHPGDAVGLLASNSPVLDRGLSGDCQAWVCSSSV